MGDGEAGVGVGGEVRVEVGVDVDVEGGVGSDGRSSSTPIAMPNVASRTLESKRVRMRARAGHPPSNHWEVEMPWRRLPDPRLVSVLALGASLMSGCACESVVSVTPRDAGGPDAYRPPVGRYDECGNGLDDDGDGAIDEDCPCGTGETQPCWDGARAARGVGACGDGVQQCSAAGSDEFGRWLSCTMSRGPDSESCEGSTDEDCDGAVDEGCTCTEGASRACTGPSEGACSAGTQTCRGGAWTSCEGAVGPVAEVCSNGVDDDCDGISDDPSFCACSPVAEVCGNGVDDDCDGETDESPCASPTPDAGMPDAGLPDANMEPFDTGTRDDSGGVEDPIVEVAAGWQHTCALRSSGRVLCWGDNILGALGDGTTEDRLAPTAVVDLNDAVQIQAGSGHTCARRRDGSVVCWGSNRLGQIGDGTCSTRGTGCPAGADRLRPTPVAGLADAVEIAAGGAHTCARRGDGRVFCWGKNSYGAIGDGTCSSSLGPEFGPQPARSGTDRWSPTEVTGLTDAVEVTAGGGHTCARRASGEVLCWGSNFPNGRVDGDDGSGGAVGDGTTINRLVPTRVLGLTGAVQVTAGGTYSCALRAGGDVACWGGNAFGGLGDGTTTTRLVPTPVPALADVVEIRAASGHTCARLGSGAVRCWGANGSGQVGDDTTSGPRLAPTVVVDLVDATGLTTRGGHSCALRRDGSVVCWGHNEHGQLGDGTTTNRPAPRAVRGL